MGISYPGIIIYRKNEIGGGQVIKVRSTPSLYFYLMNIVTLKVMSMLLAVRVQVLELQPFLRNFKSSTEL